MVSVSMSSPAWHSFQSCLSTIWRHSACWMVNTIYTRTCLLSGTVFSNPFTVHWQLMSCDNNFCSCQGAVIWRHSACSNIAQACKKSPDGQWLAWQWLLLSKVVGTKTCIAAPAQHFIHPTATGIDESRNGPKCWMAVVINIICSQAGCLQICTISAVASSSSVQTAAVWDPDTAASRFEGMRLAPHSTGATPSEHNFLIPECRSKISLIPLALTG